MPKFETKQNFVLSYLIVIFKNAVKKIVDLTHAFTAMYTFLDRAVLWVIGGHSVRASNLSIYESSNVIHGFFFTGF
jgi:hypothetical protein